jgi:actin-like ATPase involved in cell morphogenesis
LINESPRADIVIGERRGRGWKTRVGRAEYEKEKKRKKKKKVDLRKRKKRKKKKIKETMEWRR